MFRNLSFFRFSAAVSRDLERLPEALAAHRLRPCDPCEMGTRGFVPPVGRTAEDALHRRLQDRQFLVVGAETKLLPAGVVNDELARKVQKISDEEGRAVGGRERKRLKEDVLNELLPRAFVQQSRMGAYVDTAQGWLVIDTASRKAAEQLLSQVREALGSFPAVPLAPEEGPRVLMTDWLASGNLPSGFALGDECELRDPATATGARWKGRAEDLSSEEVREHLRNGKQVFQLGLVFADRLSFVLGEDLVIRKLKLLDVCMDTLDTDHTDAVGEFDAINTLLAGEVGALLARLADIFSIPRPVDADVADAGIETRKAA